MRSTIPIPGDPWPHEMGITVEDRPHALLELLWIREVYELQPHGDDQPPPLAPPPRADAVRPASASEKEEWSSAWPALWAAAAAHAGREVDHAVHQRLMQTADGSPERARLLREVIGPTWRDRFASDVVDQDPYREWNEATSRARRAAWPPGAGGDVLRRDLDAVVAAWRAGMTRIVTVPCRGEYSRRISGNALLITDETMAGSEGLRRALRLFG